MGIERRLGGSMRGTAGDWRPPAAGMGICFEFPLWLRLGRAKLKGFLDVFEAGKEGAGGGTRTRTPLSRKRILSPLRLPFRHTGKC